jgi:biopolymer transport protein ExbB
MNAILTLALLLAPAQAPDAQATLQKAYLKELAFLKAEKATLAQRVSEVDKDAAARLAQGKAELERLEARVLAVRSQADALEDRLREAERGAEQVDNAEVLVESLSRAREPLVAAGLEVPALPADRAATPDELTGALTATFRGAAELLAASGRVQRGPGRFFLTDGTQVEGEILRVGRVAAYGVSPQGGGALAPAGGDSLRVWPVPARTTAEALAQGQSPDTLRVLLFEPSEQPMVAKEERSFLEEVDAGGMIAWVIVALGAVAALMALARLLTLAWIGAQTRRLVGQVVTDVAAGHLARARVTVNAARGAAARVLQATLRVIHVDRSRVDDVIEESMLSEVPTIERFGAAITVIGAVAPLLGLLGTVTGMISTFDVITEFGTGDPRMLSGGISEALITTKLGLVVAIPALLVGTLLNSRAEAIITDIEHAALRVVNASDGLARQSSAETGSPGGSPVAAESGA